MHSLYQPHIAMNRWRTLVFMSSVIATIRQRPSPCSNHAHNVQPMSRLSAQRDMAQSTFSKQHASVSVRSVDPTYSAGEHG